MAKKVYVGIGGKARKVKQIYIGIGGLARKVKKAYVGVGGVARPFWNLAGQVVYYGEIGSLSNSKQGLASGSFDVPSGSNPGITAFFAGGRGQSSFYNDFERYDPNLTKSIGDSLGVARAYLGCGDCGNYIAFGGGQDAENAPSNLVDVYQFGGMKSYLNLTTARYDMATASMAHYYCFFIGGLNGNRNGINLVEYFNPNLTLFTLDLSFRTYGAAAATIGNHVIFAGGGTNEGDGPTGRAVLIDNMLTVQNLTSLSNVKSGLAGTSISNYAIFGGGANETGEIDTTEYFQSVDAYDSDFTRIQLSPLSDARAYLGAVSNGGYAIFGPGKLNGYGLQIYSSQVDVYDSDLVKQSPVSTAQGRINYGFANAGNYSVLAGGRYSLGSGILTTNMAEAYTTQ